MSNCSKVSQRGRLNRALTLLGAALLTGCAGLQGYDRQVSGTVNSLKTGSVENALAELERNNTGADKDLLYFLEKGELLRMKGTYDGSRDAWLAADEKVRNWEEAVKTDASKTLGDIGSFIFNDTTRRYDGRDYEKVFVNVRLALGHLALGNWAAARTEIKKMHEREAVIAEFRAKELDAAVKQSEQKGIKATSFKDLKGYPIETLEDPAVRALKNAHESAFANYLAGFVYEALGEPSLAAAGYRKAAEMRPGQKMLEDTLANLDARASKSRHVRGMVDTLFVIESGSAPAITSQTLPILLPIPSRSGVSVVATPISWPVVRPLDPSIVPSTISVDDRAVPVSLLTNVDHMARKALADEMPGIILRSSIRAIAKGAAQKAVQDNSSQMGMFGAFLSLATTVAAVVTEQADERAWRTLPAFFSVGRASLPAGTHKVTIQTISGLQTREIQLSGPHAVVALRVADNSIYLAQTPYTPAPLAATSSVPSVSKAVPAVAKKSR